jgi:hypothetical protein
MGVFIICESLRICSFNHHQVLNFVSKYNPFIRNKIKKKLRHPIISFLRDLVLSLVFFGAPHKLNLEFWIFTGALR